MAMYEDIAETLRTSIGRNKIKYSVLDDLNDLPHINALHINLDSIFSFITAKYLVKSDIVDESYRYTIAAAILNIAAHYRHYCIKRKWTPTVYLYATYKWNGAIESSMRLVEIISTYLEKIYFVKVAKEDFPAMYMKYFINQNNGYNLVLTKDVIDLQLVSDKTHVVHLNKDNSKYYKPSNIFNEFAEIDDEKYNLSKDLIGPVIFFSGLSGKGSGIKGFGKKKTVRLFDNLVNRQILYNGLYTSYEDLEHDIRDSIEEDLINFRTNFRKFDLCTNYKRSITIAKQKILEANIIDKFAKKDLLELNNKYFIGLDAIQIEYLLEFPADKKAGGFVPKW